MLLYCVIAGIRKRDSYWACVAAFSVIVATFFGQAFATPRSAETGPNPPSNGEPCSVDNALSRIWSGEMFGFKNTSATAASDACRTRNSSCHMSSRFDLRVMPFALLKDWIRQSGRVESRPGPAYRRAQLTTQCRASDATPTHLRCCADSELVGTNRAVWPGLASFHSHQNERKQDLSPPQVQ